MKPTLLLFLALCLLPCTRVRAQNDTLYLSLDQAKTMALTHQASYQSSLLDAGIARQRVLQATREFLPQLSADFDFRYNIERPASIVPGQLAGQPGEDVVVRFGKPINNTASLTLNQVLFAPAAFKALKALRKGEEVSQLEAEVSAADLRLAVSQQYLQLRINQARLNQLRADTARLANTVALTRVRVDNGLLNQIELDRTETALANGISAITLTQNAIDLGLALLKIDLGLAADRPLALTEDLLLTDRRQDLAELSLSSSDPTQLPESRLARTQSEVSALALEQHRAGLLPTASLYADLGTSGYGDKLAFSGNDPIKYYGSLYAGVTVSLPLNPLFNNRVVSSELKLQLAQTQLQEQSTIDQARTAELRALTDLTNAYEAVLTAERNVEFATRESDYYLIRMEGELASAKDLVDADLARRAAQLAYWVAAYNYELARLSLLRARGAL